MLVLFGWLCDEFLLGQILFNLIHPISSMTPVNQNHLDAQTESQPEDLNLYLFINAVFIYTEYSNMKK